MTIPERLDAFQAAFPRQIARWPWCVQEQGREVLYGIWVIGQDYRNKTQFYGAYPPSYLPRVMALFPDAGPRVLHVFSGSLPKSEAYERCDLVQDAELRCSVYDLPEVVLNWRPRLVLADPPYSAADAERYGTAMIDRRRAIAALAEITDPGGHLCWLDTCWPIHSKRQWVTVGRILVQRSTNHRVRLLSIFERVA